MLICLWKGCEFAFEDMAALQEHVVTKHVQQQQHQQQQQQLLHLSLDTQKDVGTKEEEDHHGEPMAKRAKMNEKEESKMIERGGKRKIILMAIEVWVDVLGFVKRIQLAHSICFINCKIYEICWPRLHGNKVMAHPARNIIIGSSNESGHPPKALLLNDFKKVPFPECQPPDYITGFEHIHIRFLDIQVLAFLSLIAPRIAKVSINFLMKMSHMDKNQLASVNRLLQICREKMTTIPSSIRFSRCLCNIQFLPDVDNKMGSIDCSGIEESDIPILMRFLASPRADEQQRVMKIFMLSQLPLMRKLLDAIKEEFRTSTQPAPQPYFLQFRTNVNIPQCEEQNPQTDEALTIMPRENWYLDICRYPRGQQEQCAENARKRLIELPNNSITRIHVDISEFGMPFCSP